VNDAAHNSEDDALDWLFAQARKYPLLDAEGERRIDEAKWQSLGELARLMMNDRPCRAYLHTWAGQLLERPPDVAEITDKEQYNLLKRELSDYFPGNRMQKPLQDFQQRMGSAADRDKDRQAIESIEIPGTTVAGLAEMLSRDDNPRSVASALIYWHKFWPADVLPSPPDCSKSLRPRLRQQLLRYYRARGKLVNHNLRLVFSIAGKLTGRNVNYRDLAQEGVIGLIRAAEKFQHQRGYRFSTYAFNWINQSIRRAVADQGGIVRYPAHVNEQLGKLHAERQRHLNRTGEEPASSTLASSMDLSVEKLESLRQISNLAVSLDAPLNDEPDGYNLGGMLCDGDGEDDLAARDAEQDSLRRYLAQRMQSLSAAEQRVIRLRWGLGMPLPLSRAEIAVHMQVSTEWVRQLESSALGKLRRDAGLEQAYRSQGGEAL
jgi:RNA polymerase sigma factor (sigma-70 family)